MDDIRAIKKNMKLACKEAAAEMAELGSGMLYKYNCLAIEAFYNDYDPFWYRRTFSTYAAMRKYQGIPNFSGTEMTVSFGIRLSADNMGNPYRAHNTEWVFNRTYRYGIHGITDRNYSRTKWAKIKKTRKDGKEIEINFKPYKPDPFKDVGVKSHIPLRCDPSPKKIMDEYFEDFKEKDLPALAEECMNKAMAKYF